MNIRQIMSAAFAIGVSMSGWAFDWSGRTGTVELPAGDVEVNEADLPVVTELTEITLPDASTRLIFQATSDFTLKGMIHGEGKVVKKNANTMTLGEINCATKIGGACADHYVSGGFEIENGTLELPQASTTAHSYPAITLGSAATLRLQKAAATYVRALIGSGTVTSAATANQGLQLGFKGDTATGDFTGKILGGKITVSVVGHARLLGDANTFSGNTSLTVYRNSNTDAGRPVYGALDIMKFGKTTDAASSVGSGSVSLDLRFSGYLTYLGAGEETDRQIAFRYLTSGACAYPDTLDAGPTGGVTFKGAWEFAKQAGTAGRVDLTGSNTVPCVVACEIKDGWNEGGREIMYLTKKGSGTWRFKDHASRNNRGGIAVEEGTLQFDSLAEAGTVCSLGLATCLQKSYQGTATAENDVDYAYLLGGATTNVVFEFTGGTKSATTTRPIALTGLGAHFRNSAVDGGMLSFSGVSSMDATERTLWLDGTNTTGRIGDITGAVGVTKEGSGTWTLTGEQSFTGPLNVKEGTLAVSTNNVYTWFRLKATGIRTQVFFCTKFALYDKDGNWINDGVTMIHPPELGETSTYSTHPVDYRWLEPGQATVSSGINITYNLTLGSITQFFDDSADGYWRSALHDYGSGFAPSVNGPNVPIVFRLPEGVGEAVACDIKLWGNTTTTQTLSAFTLEGSTDGLNWHTLLKKVASDKITDALAADGYTSFELPSSGNNWVSTDTLFSAGQKRTDLPWTFVGHETAVTAAPLAGASTVTVAADAKLKAEDGLTLSKLTLDCAAGALGTIEGVAFAEEGVLNLTGVGKTDQVVTTSFVNCTGVGNLAKWTVRIDGVDSNRRFVEVGDGELKIRCRGLAVILR